MSSSKADSRYTNRFDDVHVDTDPSESSADEEIVPSHLWRTRVEWKQVYAAEIELLYDAYMEVGRALFGGAFHQLGSANELANFVFKYMQPGAN